LGSSDDEESAMFEAYLATDEPNTEQDQHLPLLEPIDLRITEMKF
jgi:hypothetical protein